jgi:hypothetical protein
LLFVAASPSRIFSSLSRSEQIPNNFSYAWHMKLYFHQVFIHPQRTPIKWVMSVLLQRCNLSKVISDCATLNMSAISLCTGLQFRRPWTCWNRHLMELLIFNFILLVLVLPSAPNLMRTATSAHKIWGRQCLGLQLLETSLLSSRFKFHALHG